MTTKNVKNEGSILDVWAQIEKESIKSTPKKPENAPDPVALKESLRTKRDLFVKLVECGYIDRNTGMGIKEKVEKALKELDSIIMAS